ncbi:aminoglycoside 3'-phosphotransferase [Deinococcus seoulensis]|uniref:Aminoglycoside 3'-phosphotransferase n=2 Tax=Deinococcus TaxID=1298 RepID=A0ABQ2RZ82_9DEIO|nr:MULTISPECIES: APH(3') family aminoglycoside O-phosphotransferase [Deinococcus]GGR71177.1 aminoglycoside 3'-phosphotransferase [Deinococcus seoulensis]GGS38925.1 aminoglycoside 3'-phosphotransferase [Deinococcus knuensis]
MTDTPDRPQFPAALKRVLPAARWERVSGGQSGAQVWKSTRFVVKVQPRAPHPVSTLQQERERLRWLHGRLPAPQVAAFEVEDGQEFLAMTRLRGIPMSHPDALLHPERVVTLLARALRELHALPIRDCPFRQTLDVTLPLARERVQAGLIDAHDFDEDQAGRSAVSVFNELARTRPAHEDLVVTHGDATLDNLILNGELLEGLIDVGRLGIADRHADLALAARSVRSELGERYAAQFLDLYGRALVDDTKLAYYRLHDELF